MPRSDTDLSMPGCLYPSKPKYTVTSCPIQASGICSAIAPTSSACSAILPDRGRKPLDGFRNQLRRGLLRLFCGSPFGRAFWGSLGSSSNWIYRTAAQGTNALRACSSSASSSLMGSTVIPPALSPTNLASKPRPLVNRTATRFPFHSLGKYPANTPPLFAYSLHASYPYLGLSRPS